MRGEFFIDGDKIYLFPQKCVVSGGKTNNIALDSQGVNCVTMPIQPRDTLKLNMHITHPNPCILLNKLSSVTSAIKFPGVKILKQPTNFNSTISLPNVGNLLASHVSPAMITRQSLVSKTSKGLSIQEGAALTDATNEMEESFKVSPPKFIKSQKNGIIMYYSSHLYVVKNKMAGKIYYRCRNPSCAATATDGNGVINLYHQHNHEPPREEYEALITLQELKKAAAASPTERLKNIYKRTIDSRLSEVPDLHNFPKAVPSYKSVRMTMRRVIKDIYPTPRFKKYENSRNPPNNIDGQHIQEGLSIQDAAILMDATNETEESCKVSPPKFIKSQKNGIIMYYSSHLYVVNNKKAGKIYYRCRNPSCAATATDGNGVIYLCHQHNHEPPREEYEALITLQQLKKAAAANPTENLKNIYKKTLNSRLSEVPDLHNFPKAVPSYKSVRMTMRRVVEDIHPTPRCKKYENNENSPNIIDGQHIQVSPPEYLKSQKNGFIMYYSSNLYKMNHKQGARSYYKCRSKNCPVTALELDGRVIVNRQHNHEPPREEYEALVTRQEFKKAVAANPDEKLDTIYQQTISSRISKVPDLSKYPKAAPLLRSVRLTLSRAIQNEQLCRSQNQLLKSSVTLNQKNGSTKRLKMHN